MALRKAGMVAPFTTLAGLSVARKIDSWVQALEEIDGLEELALGNDTLAMRYFELARLLAAACAVRWPRVERILDMRLRAFANQLLGIQPIGWLLKKQTG